MHGPGGDMNGSGCMLIFKSRAMAYFYFQNHERGLFVFPLRAGRAAYDDRAPSRSISGQPSSSQRGLFERACVCPIRKKASVASPTLPSLERRSALAAVASFAVENDGE